MKFTIKDIIDANPEVDRQFISRMMYVMHKRLRRSDAETRMVQIPSTSKTRGDITIAAYVYDIDEAIDFMRNRYNTYRGKKYPERKRAYIEMLEKVKRIIER